MKSLPQGMAEVLQLTVPYREQPLDLFAKLSQSRPLGLLLESAEIDSKAGTQSLMLIDACLRIECQGLQVRLEPLSAGGEAVIELMEKTLGHRVNPHKVGDCLELSYPRPSHDLDQDSRLKEPSVFDLLRQLLATIRCTHSPEGLFLGGVFAYDLLASVETLPEVAKGPNGCPDYCFYLAENLLHIDHQRRSARLMSLVIGGTGFEKRYFSQSRALATLKQQCIDAHYDFTTPAQGASGDIALNHSDEAFIQQVTELKHAIVQGEIFQVVPSRSFSLACPDPLRAYRALKQSNPSPYMFYLKDRDFVLFGASPESAVKFDPKSRQIEMYPIAGTRPRGLNAEGKIDRDLDGRIELELRSDTKEMAEHMMLVDLARNDIARISEPGSRYVKDLLSVDRYSHVMHLVSRVVGTLRRDLDALHAYQACMNMGTLTGAPKLRATELIRHAEGQRRGSYGGAVGYINGQGVMDTCIVIRSAFVCDGIAEVQAGAGVVLDSDPKAEADETRHKARAVINAILTTTQEAR